MCDASALALDAGPPPAQVALRLVTVGAVATSCERFFQLLLLALPVALPFALLLPLCCGCRGALCLCLCLWWLWLWLFLLLLVLVLTSIQKCQHAITTVAAVKSVLVSISWSPTGRDTAARRVILKCSAQP